MKTYPKITLESRVSRVASALAEEMDGELVMMSIQKSRYYGLAEVGKRIWELLEKPRTAVDLCQALQQEFEVDPETCRQEVLNFLAQLQVEELIQIG